MQLPWRSAPRAALSSPLTVLVTAVAALLLTFVGAAAALHSDAAGNAAIAYQAGRLCPQSVAPVLDHRRLSAAQAATVVDTATAHAPRHGFPTTLAALYSPVRQWTWDSGLHPWSRFGWREGAMDNLRVLQGGARDGLWVPRSVAEDGGVKLGDRPALPGFPPVTAIYDDLTDPVSDYWCSERQEAVVNPLAPDGGAGAVVFFPDRDSLLTAFGPDAGPMTVTVRFPLERLPATIDEGADIAERGAALLAAVKADLPDPNLVTTGNYFAKPVEVAHKTGDTVLGAVLPLTAVSLLVGLAGVGAVTVQWCQRRRAELRLLWSRGAGPAALAARAVGELALPLLAGAALGWLTARAALPWYAPSPQLSPGIAAWSALIAAVIFAAALLTVAAVTAAHTHRTLQAAGGPRRALRGLRRLPWELLAAVAAVLAWVRLESTPTALAFGQPLPESPDAVGLAFPLLVVLTVALLTVRATRWALRRAHHAHWWSVPAAQLALRRLAAAAGSAAGILLVGTLAVGTLTVGIGIATAQDDAFDTKSGLFVGAESTAQISTRVATDTGLPPAVADTATLVGVVKADNQVVIAVDPATFIRAAWVDGDPDDLAAHLALLTRPTADGAPLPALRVGAAPDATTRLPRVGDVTPVGHLPSFPLIGARGWVVATTAVPDPADIDIWQVWSPEPLDALLADLDAAGLHHLHARAKSQALDGLPFLTVRWTFDFVTALGFVLAVVAAAALLLAVEVRRRHNALAGALATRMGLRPRTLVASHLLELGSLAGVSVLAGSAAGWACTAVSAPMFDPSPWLRPLAAAPDLVGLVSTTLATAVAVVALVCWSAVRSVTAARVGELIRG